MTEPGTGNAGREAGPPPPAPAAQFPAESRNGEFVRQRYQFRGRFSNDGSTEYPAVAGRYHLYVSLACPWAHRAIIVRRLLGLEEAISMSVVDPVRDERGWAFRDGPGHGPDGVCGFEFLSEAYLRTDPSYEGRYTVPCIWDRVTQRLVTNDYPDITIDFETAFAPLHAPGAPDLYPPSLREEIDAVNALVYRDVNDGVYRAGFATAQDRYERAVAALFARLDWLEERLAHQRFLVGGQLTEADIRLFTTLARFDAVYHGHFKCNLRRLVDYPVLWGYARDLFQRPGFGETVNFDHIKRHYYMTHDRINPTRIVPVGPLTDWSTPHGRDRFRVTAPAAARPAARDRGDARGSIVVRDARLGESGAVRTLTLEAYGVYARLMSPVAWATLEQAVRDALAIEAGVDRIVAVEGDRIVGSVRLYPPDASSYGSIGRPLAAPELRLLAVAPDVRGRGVGRLLVEECIRRARAGGFAVLGLHTSASMADAVRLYRAMGFERAPEDDFSPPGAELVEAWRLRI